MKSVDMLWEACLMEAGIQHSVRIDRDLAYAKSRVEAEGMAFLAITLPAFEKDLLRAVSKGEVEPGMFPGFRKRGVVPRFLSGFLYHLFHTDGSLRDDADPSALRALRQILLLAGKIEMPVTRKREEDAIKAFVETDERLGGIDEHELALFRTVSRNLLGSVLAEVEARLWSGDWRPRFSSGATADRESYNSRFTVRTWTERLQNVFPYWEDVVASPWEFITSTDEGTRYDGDPVSVLAREDEPSVKIALVPKTMKGPRIIAEEPSWVMYAQQGILHVMTEVLAKKKHRILSDAFSWKSQEPNRLLAREGSVDGSYATLDLSEASDRVSLELSDALYSCAPFLRECVNAARTETAKLPDGTVIKLKKFSSMGSALCFPTESMVFFIIQSIAWAESVGMDPSALRLRDLPRMRTYGDDLIVPEVAAQALIRWLEAFGLKVNARKSFTTGHFRESCGSDWFRGHDVSVFRLRQLFPESGRQLEGIDSAIEFHNHAYSAGWFLVAAAAEALLELACGHKMPRVPVGTDVSALWCWVGPHSVRLHPGLHRVQYRAFKTRQVKPVDPLDGYGALKKVWQPHGDEPREKRHLERDGRSRVAGVTLGWTSAPYISQV